MAKKRVDSNDAERSEQGKRLEEARLQNGFKTKAAAAERFGWTPSTYRAHENGQNGFGRASAIDYARAYNVDVNWLMAMNEGSHMRAEIDGAAPEIRPIKQRRSVYEGAFADVKPAPSIWLATIIAALEEVGIASDRAKAIAEIVLSVAYGQYPANLAMSAERIASDIVRKAMTAENLK